MFGKVKEWRAERAERGMEERRERVEAKRADIEDMRSALAEVRRRGVKPGKGGIKIKSTQFSGIYAEYMEEMVNAEDEEAREEIVEKWVKKWSHTYPGMTRSATRARLLARYQRWEEEEKED